MKTTIETKALIVLIALALAGWVVIGMRLIPMFLEMKKNGY